MGEQWITSWYWRWRRIENPPPSPPQAINEERAKRLAGLLDAALSVREGNGPLFLALAHARLLERHPDVQAEGVRVDYRVAQRVRFPDAAAARGAAQLANAHITRLEVKRQLQPTRGPFHLGELIAQGGLALVTLRSDVVHGAREPRLGAYVPVAYTRGSGNGAEPMQLALLDATSWRVVFVSDDVLSRAWHAPLAGGELLAVVPAAHALSRAKSGSFSLRPADAVDPGQNAPTLEMEAPSTTGGHER